MDNIVQFFKKPYIYLVIILLGIILKFYGLESRFVWIDEIYTVMHTSGVPTSEFLAQFPANEIVSITDYNDLLNLNNGKYNVRDQLIGLTEMPQFTPLHYAFLVFWHRIVGADYLDYRLFSILIFMLTLPLLFFLAKQLFRSRLAGLITTSIYAVSPFIHIYAQEARYYILWALFMVLIHYLLLKAIHKKRVIWWVFYSLATIAALYISAMSGLIIIGHLIYVWFLHKKLRLKFSVSLFFILLAYLPWAIVIINNQDEMLNSLGWQTGGISIWKTILGPWFGTAQIFSHTQGFWDYFVSIWGSELTFDMYVAIIIHALLIVLIISSIVFLIRKMPGKTSWFLLLIIIPGILFFYILDVAGDRWVSFSWRYHIVNFAGIILIVSIFLERKISAGKIFYPLLFLGIITLSVISSYNISKDDCWSAFRSSYEKVQAGELFSNADKPLLITNCGTDLGIMGFLEVLPECTSDNIDILFTTDPSNIGSLLYGTEYSNIYVYQATGDLIMSFIKQYKLDSLDGFLPPVVIIQAPMIAFTVQREYIDIHHYFFDPENYKLSFCEVTVRVKPELMPDSAVIYITGNHESIGNWNPGIIPLAENPDGTWTGVFIIESGMSLEYKITRGTWESEFTDSNGNTLPNARLDVSKDTTITIVVEDWKDL